MPFAVMAIDWTGWSRSLVAYDLHVTRLPVGSLNSLINDHAHTSKERVLPAGRPITIRMNEKTCEKTSIRHTNVLASAENF